MEALVTGGSGFIGSNLINKLLENNWKVRALTRSLRSIPTRSDLEVVEGDIRDPASADRAVRGVDVVFHLAAALPHHRLQPKDYWETNVGGTENLLRSAVQARVKRFVFVSTVGIYGPTSRSGADETSQVRVTDPYTKTKARADRLVNMYYKKYGLPTVIVRPTIGYGPGDTRPGFSDLFRMIYRRIFIPVGKGDNYLHIVYVDNLIDALILVVTKKKAVGTDFIIGDFPPPTLKEIVKAIEDAEKVRLLPFYIPQAVALGVGKIMDLIEGLGIKTPLNTKRVRFITEDRRYKIDKAQRLLGYTPRVGLEEGVRKTFQWYKGNGYIK